MFVFFGLQPGKFSRFLTAAKKCSIKFQKFIRGKIRNRQGF